MIDDIGHETLSEAGEAAPEDEDDLRRVLRRQLGAFASSAAESMRRRARALREVSDELRDRGRLAEAIVADKIGQSIDRASYYLQTADAARLGGDLRELARRRPAAAAIAMILVGFVAARFVCALRDADEGF